MTQEDLAAFASRMHDKSGWYTLFSMIADDRPDAELMFARTDAAADTGVSAAVSQIIRS